MKSLLSFSLFLLARLLARLHHRFHHVRHVRHRRRGPHGLPLHHHRHHRCRLDTALLMSIRHQTCYAFINITVKRKKKEESRESKVPLFAHNELGKLLQLLQLGDAARQALVVRVAVDVGPLLVPPHVVFLAELGHFVFDGDSLHDEFSSCCGGAGEVALYIVIVLAT